jgi:ribosomal protein S18
MAKLTVWIAEQYSDSQCYNIVARTRKAALEQIAERDWVKFEQPKKVEIDYKDAFDLFEYVTSEAGGRSIYL